MYLNKEIHINYILKQLRVLKAVAKENMTGKKWRRLTITHENTGYPSPDEEDQKSSSTSRSGQEKDSRNILDVAKDDVQESSRPCNFENELI